MCFCSENVDFLYLGGACVVARGVCMVAGGGCQGACMVAGGHAWLPGGVRGCRGHAWLHGEVWLPGGVHGCRGHVWLWGGMCGCRGACVVAGGHVWLQRGVHGCGGTCVVAEGVCVVAGGHVWLPEGGMHGCQGGGVPCDLSHHAFDVTCILSPHQLRASSYAPAYILVGHVTHMPPFCGQTDTCKNITFANFVCGR